VGKSGVLLEHKSGNISETRKDRGKLPWRPYRNSPTLFLTVPFPTPTASHSPKLQSLLSQKRVKVVYSQVHPN